MTEVLTTAGKEMLADILRLEAQGDLPISGYPLGEDWGSRGAAKKLQADGMATIHGKEPNLMMRITNHGREAMAT
jgi:hypothetical protein